MAVNTSELATIFKTNLMQVASNKNHIITFVLCMPHCLLMVKLNKCTVFKIGLIMALAQDKLP